MINKYRKHLNYIKLLLAIVLLYFLLSQSQIRIDLFFLLANAPFYLLSSLLIMLLMVALAGARWYLLNRGQGINLSLRKTMIIAYLSAAFNTILPGAVGGEVVKGFLLCKHYPDIKTKIIVTIFIDRLFGFSALVVIGLFTLIMQMQTFLVHSISLKNTGFVLCILIVACVIFSIISAKYLRLSHDRTSDSRWVNKIIFIFNEIATFKISINTFIKCFMLSAGIQLLIVVCTKIIGDSMGLNSISIYQYTIATSITQLVNLIPLTPGGIGIGEVCFANLLHLMNPENNFPSATILLAYRLISNLSYVPALFYYLAASPFNRKSISYS